MEGTEMNNQSQERRREKLGSNGVEDDPLNTSEGKKKFLSNNKRLNFGRTMSGDGIEPLMTYEIINNMC
ncbi:hypothetical protein SDJN02_09767, partial [Cucurbita argyrosperma subsp. argyrosperma]